MVAHIDSYCSRSVNDATAREKNEPLGEASNRPMDRSGAESTPASASSLWTLRFLSPHHDEDYYYNSSSTHSDNGNDEYHVQRRLGDGDHHGT